MHTAVNFLDEWKSCEKDLYKNFAILKVRLNNDAIHDMRVDIKKIRAYVKLANELEKTDSPHSIEQTQSLFDILGKHREWSLTLDVINKSTEQDNVQYPLFVAYITRAKNAWAKAVKNSIRTYNIKEIDEIGKSIEAIVHQKTTYSLANECDIILKEYVIELSKLLKHFKKEVHNIRKLLKTISYWIHLFPEDSLYNKSQVKKANAFLKELGDWHDLQMVLQKINNFCKDYLVQSFDEYKALKQLEDNLEKERDKIFSNLDIQKVVDALT